MSQRFVVGLHATADWRAVKAVVVALGASWVRDPSPAQPDVLVVAIDDGVDGDRFAGDVRQAAGVRYVEADAARWSS